MGRRSFTQIFRPGSDTTLIENSVTEFAKLKTPVDISLVGDVSGSVSFDGSTDVVINTNIDPELNLGGSSENNEGGGFEWNNIRFANKHPHHESTDITCLDSFILGSFFGTKYIATQIQIAKDLEFTDIIYNKTYNIYKHTYQLPSDLADSTEYYWRYRYQDDEFGWSKFSIPSKFTTYKYYQTIEVTEYKIGDSLGGGYFGGVIDTRFEENGDPIEGGLRYIIIVAPKAQGGETREIQLMDDRYNIVLPSNWDGLANTQILLDDNVSAFPVIQWVKDLEINGYDDWYIPAIDELELLYRNFKPTDDETLPGRSAFSAPYADYGVNPSSMPRGAAYNDVEPILQTTIPIFTNPSEKFQPREYNSSTTYKSTYYTYTHDFYRGAGKKQTYNSEAYYLLFRAIRRIYF